MVEPRELRVFISSTFRDLVDEREQLTKKIFPALRSLCRERGVEFTEIDLRWGLTDEEAHNGRIIRTCFEEIDSCRPYFIGIVGSRYGWVPPFSEIQKDPLLLKRYPWVENAALEGMSILEMEFEYGALRDPEPPKHAFFYLRSDRSLNHQSSDSSEDNHQKLTRLRDRVRSNGRAYKEYRGPETLGEMIYEDLLGIIDSNWPKDPVSELRQERYHHAAFSAARRHAYIANPNRVKYITDSVMKEKQSVVIEAPSGGGKSALLAYWAHQLQQSNPTIFLIEHYVGIGNDGGTGANIAQRIIREIIERYRIIDETLPKTEDCPSQLPFWITRITEPCIIVIDAVNQLDETSRTLAWLPQKLPPNVKFVISTTDAVLAASLAERGWAHKALGPLSLTEREAIIVRYLNEYHKSLSLEQSKRMAADPKCASPLFLRTMLEELRLTGTHKHLDEIIDRYLNARDTDELFQLVLERLEEDFGSRSVRDLMSFIWGSRYGLAERELGDLMPITRMKLSTILLALDYHLLRRDGLLGFFHNYLRAAVQARYIATDERSRLTHLAIAEYMSRQPVALRRIDEEPWQWVAAGEWGLLKDTLFHKDIFKLLAEPTRMHELSRYWRDLQEHMSITTVRDFLYPEESEVERFKLIADWAKFFEYIGKYTLAIELYQHIISELRSKPEFQLELAEALDGTSSVYYELRRLDEAEQSLKEAIALKDQLLVAEDVSSIKSYSNLGAITYAKGNLEESLEIFQKCVQMCKKYLEKDHIETAVNLNNLASIEALMGMLENALQHFRESLCIFEKRYGAKHPSLGQILENIGTVTLRLGNYSEAKQVLLQALQIFSDVFVKEHLEIAKTMNTIGIVEHRLNNYNSALEYFFNALSIREANLGSQQYETLNTKVNIARSYMMMKEYEKSISAIDTVLNLVNDKLTVNANQIRQNVRNLLSDFEGSGYKSDDLQILKEKLTEAGA